MFRPHVFLDRFNDLFPDSLVDPETVKRLQAHFGKLNTPRYLTSNLGYLPLSKAMEAGSLSDVMDGTIPVPLTFRSRAERIGRALHSGVVFAIGVPLLLLVVASRFLIRPFPFLADAPWNVSDWTTIVIGGISGAWLAMHDKWLEWFRPEYCDHCPQRYKTKEAAEQCCVNSPPSRWWWMA